MNKQEKCCDNCKYYLRHYVKSDRYIHDVNCGHCTFNRKFLNKRLLPDSICEIWQKDDKQIIRKKNLKEYIENISNKLDEFSEILKVKDK